MAAIGASPEARGFMTTSPGSVFPNGARCATRAKMLSASRNGALMIATDITAPTMIAWTEPSPSSPAPAARRCAASGLDRSLRPSKVVGHAVDASLQCLKHQTHLHRYLLHKTSDTPTRADRSADLDQTQRRHRVGYAS